MGIDIIAQNDFGYPALAEERKNEPTEKTYVLQHGEYVGHGIADNGRSYRGYVLNGRTRFFYDDDDDNFEEIIE